LGWTWAGVRTWEYHDQVQTLAINNALVAIGLLAAIRIPRDGSIRALAAGAMVLCDSLAFPAIMAALYGKLLPVRFADLSWLTLLQSLFVLAALVPLAADNAANATATSPSPQP